MKKTLALAILAFCGFGLTNAQEGLDDIFNEIDFDETESQMEEIDVNDYVRDITDDLISIDESYTEDSMERSEQYTTERNQYLQEMINKPATECFDKNSLNSLKSSTFSMISNKVLNPFYYDLVLLAETKTEEKLLLLEEVTTESEEMIEEMAKDETNVTVPLIKTVVRQQLNHFEDLIEDKEKVWLADLGDMKEGERKVNLSLKEGIEPVEGAEFGDEVCFIYSRKKTNSTAGSDDNASLD